MKPRKAGAPRKKRTKKDRHNDLPSLVLGSQAAMHLDLDPDTFRKDYLGTVFTRFHRSSGHHAIYKDELAIYLDYPNDEERAKAMVLEHRRRMGRLAGSR